MTDDARRRLAKQMAEVARGAKLMREHPAFEPMRKWQEQMRSLIAEGEEAHTSETPSTPPAPETTAPATPAPQSEAQQATDAEQCRDRSTDYDALPINYGNRLCHLSGNPARQLGCDQK
jgi:hypothetical protein